MEEIVRIYHEYLYTHIYTIGNFLSNFIILIVYFLFHYHGYFTTFKKFKNNYVSYKKYKNKIFVHMCTSFITSFIICYILVVFVKCDFDIVWNLLVAPIISFLLVSSIDNYEFRKIEEKEFKIVRELEQESYKKSLTKLIEVQEIQQQILTLHDTELGELKKNIIIVKDIMDNKVNENRENDTEDKDEEAQDGDEPS